MNKSSSFPKYKLRLGLIPRKIIKEMLQDHQKLLIYIEGKMKRMKKMGLSDEEVKKYAGFSHKCCYHKVATYIHILNGNRDEAIKTFYKWRIYSTEALDEIMENHKTGESLAHIRTFTSGETAENWKKIDENEINNFAVDMKENDKLFSKLLNV